MVSDHGKSRAGNSLEADAGMAVEALVLNGDKSLLDLLGHLVAGHILNLLLAPQLRQFIPVLVVDKAGSGGLEGLLRGIGHQLNRLIVHGYDFTRVASCYQVDRGERNHDQEDEKNQTNHTPDSALLLFGLVGLGVPVLRTPDSMQLFIIFNLTHSPYFTFCPQYKQLFPDRQKPAFS